MLFRWLKRFLPRGLYGRAILILLVPVVALQLVVSIVFLQRHFDQVTEQMTHSVAIPLGYLLAEIDAADGAEAARVRAAELGAPLGFTVTLPAAEVASSRLFYDLSGRSLTRTMRDALPSIRGIDLGADIRFVRLGAETVWGPAEIVFRRARVSASNPHQLLVIMALAGVLMTAIAYLFLRNQLRPIARLAQAAEAYGRGQVVAYRPRGATEVRAAGAAFLDMRDRIERAREQRTLLLSGVSHDLRTPLTRLRLGLSLAEDSEETRAMRRDVDAMERMLDDFLDYARGEVLGEATPVNPAALAAHVVENARRIGREIEVRLGAGSDAVAALRPRAVERALENLVQNALRYGVKVRLSLSADAKALRFAVEDDGPGIPPERVEEALRPFTRLDPARNQDRGAGAGMGLAIALDVARGHGGTLTLETSADLGGLKAELSLPR